MKEEIEKRLSEAAGAKPSIDPIIQGIIDSTAASTAHLYHEELDNPPEIRPAKELLEELASGNTTESWFEEFDSCMMRYTSAITMLKDNVDTEQNTSGPGIKIGLEFERDGLGRAIILYIGEIFSSDTRELNQSESENIPKILNKGFHKGEYGLKFQEEVIGLASEVGNDRFRRYFTENIIK